MTSINDKDRRVAVTMEQATNYFKKPPSEDEEKWTDEQKGLVRDFLRMQNLNDQFVAAALDLGVGHVHAAELSQKHGEMINFIDKSFLEPIIPLLSSTFFKDMQK